MYDHTHKVRQSRYFIGGQLQRFFDIQSEGKTDMLVVLFQPHGAKAFFNMPMSEFHNRNISIEDLGDKSLLQLADRIQNIPDNHMAVKLIEDFLVSRLKDSDLYNLNRIAKTMNAVNSCHQPDIKSLANIACLSHKQFGRIFTEYVGTTPKEFTRIIRFQRAIFTLQNNLEKDQAELALDCGFYDQAHMIKEFKTFSGYTPNEYLAVCLPYSDYFS
jgi:AraC-like DNA-binding protein